MKKIIYLFLSLVLMAPGVSAQTMEDALSHLYYQRYSSAKSVLSRIIQADSGQTAAAYQLATIYIREKKPADAKQVLEAAISFIRTHQLSEKQHPYPFIGLAHLLLNEHKREESEQLIEKVLGMSKRKDPAVLLAVSRIHIESPDGDPQYALQLLSAAVKRDKRNPELYTAMGDAYRRLVDGSRAVPQYDLAIAADPAFAEAMYKKGRIYATQRNTEVAVDRFKRAYAMDTAYVPAIYELYYYYFSHLPDSAGKYLNAYLRLADPSPSHAYMVTDYRFITHDYKEAISQAHAVVERDGAMVQPRIYKLLAYSYAAIGDSAAAWTNMTTYFQRQSAADIVVPDYDFMAKLADNMSADQQETISWYTKAEAAEKDIQKKLAYKMLLADKNKSAGNREKEAEWREAIFMTKTSPGNLDIYNWGVALYGARKYSNADSVFSLYQERYPDQVYGYLWRARCNALLDSNMQKGLAVPFYQQLVKVAEKDSVTNKNILLSAYGYLGAYEANITKNYPASLDYFERILRVKPDHQEAGKYAGILREWIDAGTGESQPDN